MTERLSQSKPCWIMLICSRDFKDRANAMERSYEFFEQAMDEKIDELDINLDGRFDYEDIAYIFAAQTRQHYEAPPRAETYRVM